MDPLQNQNVYLMTDVFNLYFDKRSAYFGSVRTDILDLLPQPAGGRFLDIGCGSGATLSYLKKNGYCDHAAGVELDSKAAASARSLVDEVYEGNIESLVLPLPPDSLDVVLCLDILEHLVDPWKVVARLAGFLKPGGAIIASIPNVRHYSALFPLVRHGRWEYSEQGVLDRSHLRFFVRETAIRLFEDVGLKVDLVRKVGPNPGSKASKLNALTLSMFHVFFELKYLIRALRIDGGPLKMRSAQGVWIQQRRMGYNLI